MSEPELEPSGGRASLAAGCALLLLLFLVVLVPTCRIHTESYVDVSERESVHRIGNVRVVLEYNDYHLRQYLRFLILRDDLPGKRIDTDPREGIVPGSIQLKFNGKLIPVILEPPVVGSGGEYAVVFLRPQLALENGLFPPGVYEVDLDYRLPPQVEWGHMHYRFKVRKRWVATNTILEGLFGGLLGWPG